MSGLYLSLVFHHSVPSYTLLHAHDRLVAFLENQMAGIAPVPFLNHHRRVSYATLSTEHPQSSVLRFVRGVGGVSKEHYSSLQPHHSVTMLTCSSNNLSMRSGVFKRLRCVQRSDWRLAFRFLHESKLINVSFFFFCRFVLFVFWGMAIPPKICHHKGA